MKKIVAVLIGIALPFIGWAQASSSLHKFTVTSVTLIMDSVNTIEEMELVRQAIKAHPEVQDFDIKMKNCNFTMSDSNTLLDQIIRELAAYNQPARIYAARASETFTRVPEESCEKGKKSIPDMSEDEVRKRGITRQGGQ